MQSLPNISFIDNSAIKSHTEKYKSVDVDIDKVLNSWKTSLFSFEWVTPEGRIKSVEELSEIEKEKRLTVENDFKINKPIEKPVLGIGLLENIEIGIGRHVFLTAAHLGYKKIPVHIPKSHEDDFLPFIYEV
jgi:hypothetical protein